MKILVTGSAGHLGEALVRTLQDTKHEVVSVDLIDSEFTNRVGSIANREYVKRCMKDVEAVGHNATLHKPHVFTHNRQRFVDTNITRTLNLLVKAGPAAREAVFFFSTPSALVGGL